MHLKIGWNERDKTFLSLRLYVCSSSWAKSRKKTGYTIFKIKLVTALNHIHHQPMLQLICACIFRDVFSEGLVTKLCFKIYGSAMIY